MKRDIPVQTKHSHYNSTTKEKKHQREENLLLKIADHKTSQRDKNT
jgi:hypothetical protein